MCVCSHVMKKKYSLSIYLAMMSYLFFCFDHTAHNCAKKVLNARSFVGRAEWKLEKENNSKAI